jgi:hypothetical protein
LFFFFFNNVDSDTRNLIFFPKWKTEGQDNLRTRHFMSGTLLKQKIAAAVVGGRDKQRCDVLVEGWHRVLVNADGSDDSVHCTQKDLQHRQLRFHLPGHREPLPSDRPMIAAAAGAAAVVVVAAAAVVAVAAEFAKAAVDVAALAAAVVAAAVVVAAAAVAVAAAAAVAVVAVAAVAAAAQYRHFRSGVHH